VWSGSLTVSLLASLCIFVIDLLVMWEMEAVAWMNCTLVHSVLPVKFFKSRPIIF
jgi:hypothetical protein